jgi:hypothetical protein
MVSSEQIRINISLIDLSKIWYEIAREAQLVQFTITNLSVAGRWLFVCRMGRHCKLREMINMHTSRGKNHYPVAIVLVIQFFFLTANHLQNYILQPADLCLDSKRNRTSSSNFVPGQARVLSMPPIASPLRAWWTTGFPSDREKGRML